MPAHQKMHLDTTHSLWLSVYLHNIGTKISHFRCPACRESRRYKTSGGFIDAKPCRRRCLVNGLVRQSGSELAQILSLTKACSWSDLPFCVLGRIIFCCKHSPDLFFVHCLHAFRRCRARLQLTVDRTETRHSVVEFAYLQAKLYLDRSHAVAPALIRLITRACPFTAIVGIATIAAESFAVSCR